jgi:uncharacterized protein YgiM (DUF1202 family)
MAMSQHFSRPHFTSILTAAAIAAGFWLAPAKADTTPAPTLVIPGSTAAAPAPAAPVTPAEPVRLVSPGAPAAAAPATPTPRTPATPAAPAAPAAAAVLPTAPAAPAAEVAPFAQPFVATITGDKVYVRSGPDQKNYEIGQLDKGDMVYVMGLSKGWYQILPPNGSFCMLDKQFVAVDAGGATGTLTGDYVNVHAGSAVYKADPYAILPPSLRKGAKVKILGSTDKYYQIAPPEKTCFFISAQFVKAAPGAEYKVAQLKLPAGFSGPSGTTVETPTVLPTVAAAPDTSRPEVPLPGTGSAGAAPSPTPAVGPTLPPIEPKVTFSETAMTRFSQAHARYQEEARKPLAQQQLDGLVQEFKDILAIENASPSVKAGSEANIAAIERTITVQKLLVEQAAANADTKVQADALRQQLADADKAIAAARDSGPYSAEGLLQTSNIVSGKYALVNPQTGRVVAYVDPSTASVDIGKLIGNYIGVRGMTKRMDNSDIMVIQVNNATLMPPPK